MATPTPIQLDFYTITIAQYIHVLDSLIHVLTKASEAPNAATFPTVKLHEDMKDFSFQVQIVTGVVLKAVLRITGKDFGDVWAGAKTIPEFIDRARTTLDHVKSISPDEVNGKENELVTMERGSRSTLRLPALAYVLSYTNPNIFFHLTTTYGLLRKEGVPLGKADYLAPFLEPFEGYAVKE